MTTTIITVLIVALIVLAMALLSCYQSNKPLREKAREEAEAKAREAARQAAHIDDLMRRNNQREEIFTDLNAALNDPHKYLSATSTLSGGHRWKFSALADVALALSTFRNFQADNEARRATQRKQASMLGDQAAQIKALQANIEDIKQALQMGTPVEF